MTTARATAWAPLTPSGWLCVGSAVCSASASTVSTVARAQPTGDARMAEPFPKLPYGCGGSVQSHCLNAPP
jgi:hypothetical protein